MEEYIVHLKNSQKMESLRRIEEAITLFRGSDDENAREAIIAVLESIREAIVRGDQFIIPVEVPRSAVEAVTAGGSQVGDTVDVPEDLRFKVRSLALGDGTTALCRVHQSGRGHGGRGDVHHHRRHRGVSRKGPDGPGR